MRFAVIAAATIAATSLAGCGGPPEQKAPVNPAETAAAYQARLQALPEGARNGVFIRAIRDARQDCQHVESSAPTRGADGTPVWFAQCTGGATYAIAIRNGGIAQVLPERGQPVLTGGTNSVEPGNIQ